MESWYTYRVQKDQISSQHRVYIAGEVDKEIERLKNLLLKGMDVQTVCEMEMWRADVREILKEK